MDVTSLPRAPGTRHRRKRVGRGMGSGHGKTATRGQKGQRARTGSRKKPGFEGGRNPLIRRLPKRGFRRKERRPEILTAIVNVGQLSRCGDGERVDPARLADLGLIRDGAARVKLLGDGEIGKRVTVAVHAASAAAKSKIEQHGGTIELLARTGGPRREAQGSTPQPPASRPEAPA